MKLPWDKNYLKIAFHVIFTLVVTYLAIVLIDGVAIVIMDIFDIIGRFFSGLGWLISLFSPLVLSFLMAYLLDPLAELYQKFYERFRDDVALPWLSQNTTLPVYNKRKVKGTVAYRTRFMGATLTYATIVVGLGLLVRIVAQQFEAQQVAAIISEMAETVTHVVDNVTAGLDQFEFLLPLSDYLAALTDVAIVWVTESLPDILTAAATTGAWILDFFIAFVVAFYFITHKARIKSNLQQLLETFTPTKVNQVIRLFLADLHFVFSGYIRGMMLDGMILGTLIALTLSLPFIGAQLAIPIGIVTVIFNMIPFFGGIMAFIIAVVSELILGTPTSALYAAIAIVIIQQIDSIFIIPRVVGQNVKLSAPVVMLSLTIAGTLFGIMGMLLIVPTLAILKIFASRFLERYATYQQQKRRGGRAKETL